MAEFIEGSVNKVTRVVKKGKPHLLLQQLKTQVLAPVKDNIPDIETQKRCEKASEEAKNPVAEVKKKLSKTMRHDLGMAGKFENLNVSDECKRDILALVEEYVYEGLNLADAVDRKIEKELEKDPEADISKYDNLRAKALKVPDSAGKVSKNVKGGLATDKRRNLTDEQEEKLRDERIADELSDLNSPKARTNSVDRNSKKTGNYIHNHQ